MAAVTVVIRRSFLHDQAVGGYMLRLQHGRLLQRIPPGLRSLPRNGGDQIHVDIRKSRHAHPLEAL